MVVIVEDKAGLVGVAYNKQVQPEEAELGEGQRIMHAKM